MIKRINKDVLDRLRDNGCGTRFKALNWRHIPGHPQNPDVSGIYEYV